MERRATERVGCTSREEEKPKRAIVATVSMVKKLSRRPT
jgi:hypothetical protein